MSVSVHIEDTGGTAITDAFFGGADFTNQGGGNYTVTQTSNVLVIAAPGCLAWVIVGQLADGTITMVAAVAPPAGGGGGGAWCCGGDNLTRGGGDVWGV